jgi:uncharacterized membrane protein
MSQTQRAGQSRCGMAWFVPVFAPVLLLLVAACDSGVGNANSQGSDSKSLSAESKAPAQYRFQFFDVPGAVSIFPWTISDLGVVTGFFLDSSANPESHSFIRSATGDIETFAASDAAGEKTFAQGVNDFGVVVGYELVGPVLHGFFRAPNGRITQIDVPGATDTYVSAVNNLGDVVGGYDFGDPINIGFLLRDGEFASLKDPPGSAPKQNFPTAINDLGWVSGYFFDPAGVEHGYVLREGVYTIVNFPGETAKTELFQSNDRGQIIVNANSDMGCSSIFDVLSKTFSPAPCAQAGSEALGINNRSQLTGSSNDDSGANHGFIATPVRSEE